MDLAQAFSELKSLPDVALQKELASPTGSIPGYMVIGELHERKTMRAGAGKSPDETIKRKSMAEEYMGDIKSMMPMTMQGMQPPRAMPPQAVPPPQTASPMGGGIASIPQQGYWKGGMVRQSTNVEEVPVSYWEQFLRSIDRGETAPALEWEHFQERQRINDEKRRLATEARMAYPQEELAPQGNGPLSDVARTSIDAMDKVVQDQYLQRLRLLPDNYLWKYKHDNPQGYAGGGIVGLDSNFRQRLIETANAIGADPVDLATAISYETAGTFDPMKRGPTTKWGQHRGLIQFGEPQAQQYGVDWNDPVNSQLGAEGAVAKYFRASGFKPGMSGLDLYSTINAGAPGKYSASDTAAGGAPGDVRDKWMNQMAGHRAKAEALLGSDYSNAAVAAQAADTAGSMAATETAAAPAAAGDPISQYLLMQQLFTQAQPQVAQPQLQAPVVAQPQQDYREVAEETSMRPDFYRRQRSYG